MRYVIAGGGAYGDHYVHKLLEAINLGKVALDEIIVVDRDADCRVAQTAEASPRCALRSLTGAASGHRGGDASSARRRLLAGRGGSRRSSPLRLHLRLRRLQLAR